MNILAMISAAIAALLIGAIWYGVLFKTSWMRVSGVTEEQMKETSMPLLFLATLFFAFLISFSLNPMVIHQIAAEQLAFTNPESENLAAFLQEFQDAHRTFGHGAFHGVLIGLFFAFPLLATNALFDRKPWKYIWINAGYWVITLGVIGGIICAWV